MKPSTLALLKGTGPVSAEFARGGPSITSKSRFMKVPDQFTGGRMPPKETAPVKQDYNKTSKGGELSDTEGDSKKLPPIKPRK